MQVSHVVKGCVSNEQDDTVATAYQGKGSLELS